MHTEPKFTVIAELSEGLKIWGRASSNVMGIINLPTPTEIGLNNLLKSDAPPPPSSDSTDMVQQRNLFRCATTKSLKQEPKVGWSLFFVVCPDRIETDRCMTTKELFIN